MVCETFTITIFFNILITINSEDYELSKTKFKLHNGGKVYYIPGVGIDLTQYELPDNVRKIKRTELGLKETDIDLLTRKAKAEAELHDS